MMKATFRDSSGSPGIGSSFLSSNGDQLQRANHNYNFIYYSQQHEKEIQLKVDFKMKSAANRRNEILSHRSHAAKKEGKVVFVCLLWAFKIKTMTTVVREIRPIINICF